MNIQSFEAMDSGTLIPAPIGGAATMAGATGLTVYVAKPDDGDEQLGIGVAHLSGIVNVAHLNVDQAGELFDLIGAWLYRQKDFQHGLQL